MFARLRISFQRRRITRQDRELLETRARRFLNRYLSANDDTDNDRYYEALAAAAAACQPKNVVSYFENLEVAEITAEAASAVVRRRLEKPEAQTDAFITDACATVAVGYRRAAGIYARDHEMRTLGTAAVHLLTMATSRGMAKSKQESPDALSPDWEDSSSQPPSDGSTDITRTQ
jgi:hypothetical protein